MSSKTKDVVPAEPTTETLPVKPISEEEKKRCIQQSIYYLTEKEIFYGTLLQQMNMNYDMRVPTAGLTFDKKNDSFKIMLNPHFFCGMELPQRIAILEHEILHFTNKHLFRLPFVDASQEDRTLYNIAGDMAINQYIENLPPGGIDYKNFKTDLGQPFPERRTMEEYYELLKTNPNETKKQLKNYKPFDEHDWWDSLSEEEKQKMLQEAKKLVKRTIEKTNYSHSNVPDSIKDLLDEIDSLCKKLDYKGILKRAIKKTVSAIDRDHTWKKPNKRYGEYSPGTRVGALPRVAFFNDSSGSISITEQNEYLKMMTAFLKVGARDCILGFWHTNLYYKKKYKMGQKITPDILESGGTDVSCVLEDIKKNNYNLSIIFTDGFYENSNIKVTSEVIFIISKGGNLNHPLKNLGKTIELDKIK